MAISIKQLRYLLKAADQKSISVAAKQLGVAHGTLSEAISQIEATVGFNVLERNRRGVAVTSQGAELLKQARAVVEQMDLLEMNYCGGPGPARRFAVDAQPFDFAARALSATVSKPEHAQCNASISYTLVPRIVEDVRTGACDLGVVCLTGINELQMNDAMSEAGLLEYRPLFDAKPYVFVSSSHPLAKRKSLTEEDLRPYPKFEFDQYLFMVSLEANDVPPHVENGITVQGASLLPTKNFVKNIASINGYTVRCNLTSEHANEDDAIAVIPLKGVEPIKVGCIIRKDTNLDDIGHDYLEELKSCKR